MGSDKSKRAPLDKVSEAKPDAYRVPKLTRFKPDPAYWRDRFRNNPNLGNDWGFWASYLEGGGLFFDELRPVLAKALRGEKRPRQRIKSVETCLRQVRSALCVLIKEQQGCRRDKAVEEAAGTLGVTKRTVQAAVAKYLPKAGGLSAENRFEIMLEIFDAAVGTAGILARNEKK
jgi:hypothetical protein